MSEPIEPEIETDYERGPAEMPAEIRYGWFDGILQGHVGRDPGELRSAVRRLNDVGLTEADLRIEGGRFSILLHEGTVPGREFSEDRATRFRDALEDLVELLPRGESLESTLRCTMVTQEAATETLFGVVQGRVRPVSRKRPLRASDHARSPSHGQMEALQQLGHGKLLAILALLLVAFAGVAWQTGYIDRAFSPAVARLEVDRGDFEGLLEMEVESSWGRYVVRLTRGERFPETADAVAALLAERESTRAQAAVRLVADGDRIWVQLRALDGSLLAAAAKDLRPLLEEAKAVVELRLDGKIGTRRIQLALSSGRQDEQR